MLGIATIRDVNRELELELPGEEEVNTISGLCVHVNNGRIPATGTILVIPDCPQIEILEASVRRVRRVRVMPGIARKPRD